MFFNFTGMKKGIYFILFLVPCLLFGQDSLNASINSVLDEWHAAAAKADMAAYFETIDEEGVYIGTDASENWTKQAFYDWSKPYFDNGKAWTFKAVERNIYFSDDQSIAWFDEKLEASYGMLRGSGVLRLKNGEWKIMHYVLSLPVPNEKLREVNKLITGATE